METTILIAVVVGLTEVIKRATNLSSRFAPLVSLVLAIGLAFLGATGPISNIIFTGIIVGLSASGLYSGAKAVATKK